MPQPEKILVVDDDRDIREVVRLLLTGEGYEIKEAASSEEAISMADEEFDLIILDVMMPGISGFAACEQIRRNSVTPILFLTAKSQDSDKTMGFAAGGDDYLVKPFSYNELVYRVKAMIRRYRDYGTKQGSNGKNSIVHIKDLTIDTDSCEVSYKDTNIPLTDIEYNILLLLASYPQKVFSAQNLYESIWEEPYFYSSNNTVMVHIRNLRKKLGLHGEAPDLIKTVWGKGYKII